MALLGRKGYTVGDLAPLAIAFMILTIVVGVSALILGEMKNTTTDPDAQTIISKGVDAMGTFADWFGILVIVVIAAVVIGLVIGYFRGKGIGA